jgi:hypothetical protein
MDLSPQQAALLQRIHTLGFELVAFPIYPNHVGVRKGNCAALLAPIASGSFHVFGEPTYVVDGNLSAKIILDGREHFVWKKQKLEATPARRAELEAFVADLAEALPKPT